MAQYFEIHPENPQRRLIHQSVDIIRQGGVIAYPTDSSYALGCHIGDKRAMERIRDIRRVDHHHHFTLVCRNLAEISTYTKIDNTVFRLLKSHTPGPYTFLLDATHEVPRRLQHPKRRTIGIRIPDNAIVSLLLEELGEPLMSSTLILPDEDLPMSDPYAMREQLGHQLDLVIDGGACGFEPTTVVDMTGGTPIVARHGKGDSAVFD
ncbi:MAG TPA: threonylcarbamoyl-AMP synthase [Chromatiaceae bacterium]|jgi:tRNA threonylcarbamoyl adenosine modification protein (Sua5/YciO/YrdC/YwlC family)|nr:threonylcarbamoyl-AMP synthase [Chromatiaceae bacterium]HIN83157.1 threonylcarbamoyl-AMP synthase [Chromatiales bacterium]HIA09261.1 threonylcarbamoyl-AMP synthase [Chromatiaceae bacterium]HIB84186.1 threonylcarbamoyl-AMP synthase [Chromatiaceae bacterium]HIO13842.1 threonylcarbamoyl-AMP synthase [Chromatiales bacterium]